MELKPNTVLFNNRYCITSCIGSGGFGITYLARDNQLGRNVVLKEYFPKFMVRRDLSVSNQVILLGNEYKEDYEKGISRFLSEAKALALLEEVSEIATVYDFFKENETAYIVMEYIKGKNLKQIIKERSNPFSFDEAVSLVRPCLEALKRVHESGLIHRDFTPDNIIINEKGKPKIIDFGSSRDYVSSEATMTVMVKHGYAPIEQYSNGVKQGTYTDVYSISAILYEMVTLQKPMASIERLRRDPLLVPSKFNSMISQAEDAVIMKGLEVDYEDRFQTIEELLTACDTKIVKVNDDEKTQSITDSSTVYDVGNNNNYQEVETAWNVSNTIDSDKTEMVSTKTEMVSTHNNMSSDNNWVDTQIQSDNSEKYYEDTSIEKKPKLLRNILIIAALIVAGIIVTLVFISFNKDTEKSNSKTDNNKSTTSEDEISEDETDTEHIIANSNFSENLDDNGYVKDVTAKDIVILPKDYDSITIPYSEIEYTDVDYKKDVTDALEKYRTINTKTVKKIEKGDEINLDYVGYIDGIEFNGGSSNGQGADLIIGSGNFIPGFEDQLIGHKVGEVFDINVTFPTNYSGDLAGKDAVFTITINGIYVTPEFNDEFIKSNFSDVASTVNEYKTYLKEKNERDAKRQYIANYLALYSSLSKYPKGYLKQLKGNQKYLDQKQYDYICQMYEIYGMPSPSSFEEFVGMTEEEYDASLDEMCKQQETENLVRQAICEMQGFTVTDEEIKEYVISNSEDTNYQTILNEYGRGYFAQLVIGQKAIDYLIDNAVVK